MAKVRIGFLAGSLLIGLMFVGCAYEVRPTSDQIQKQRQETLLKEGTAQAGMPNIKNFRELKLMKDIIELRDQEGLVTYTYMENMIPHVVTGKTALGGKLVYLGESVGYGLPYATQYTNPMKIESQGVNYGYAILPQAEPNGLFSPESAEGTWVILKDPGSERTGVVYIEPRIVVSPFKYPFD